MREIRSALASQLITRRMQSWLHHPCNANSHSVTHATASRGSSIQCLGFEHGGVQITTVRRGLKKVVLTIKPAVHSLLGVCMAI